jgi:flagellar biosynthesis anti-sigma factor FlgM
VQIDPRPAKSTPPAAPARRVSRGAGAPPAAPAAAPDSVSISSEARALAATRQALEAAADVREDRVADLKQRIARGDYDVPADTLARALLDKNAI